MKFLLKISLILTIFIVSSCELTDLDLQENPNAVAPENVELDFLFNNLQYEFSNFWWEASDETMAVTRMMAMTGGNTYNNNDTPVSFNYMWNRAYSEVFADADAVIASSEASEQFVHAGIARVLKAYTMMTLVDLFGDVPYSEAGKGIEFQNPNRDDDAAVYAAAKGILEAAKLNFAATSLGTPSTDIFYGGDAAAWMKAANSLLIRYEVTTKLAGGSGAAVKALVDGGNFISTMADDFQFQYGTQRSTPDARHPHYSTDYETDADYYQSNYFMWSLLAEKGIEDPRLRYYFYRQDCNTVGEDLFTLGCAAVPRPPHYTGDYPWCVASEEGWWGRDHGDNDGIPPDGLKRTTFGVYPAGGKFDNDDCVGVANDGSDGLKGGGILPILTASFVDFMRAEAALTMSSGEDARALLESAVRKSMAKVMNFGASQASPALTPAASDVDGYVNLVLGLFDTAASNEDKLAVVCKEYHIALWGNGVDAFNMYRRTGYPSGMQPTREPSSGDYPRTYFYPQDHITLNLNADQRDDIGEQVFWDTNAANPGWID